MSYREEIGGELQTLRVQKGMSQRELAEASGVHYSNIAKIEMGRYNVSIDILGKVADALGHRLAFEPKTREFNLNDGVNALCREPRISDEIRDDTLLYVLDLAKVIKYGSMTEKAREGYAETFKKKYGMSVDSFIASMTNASKKGGII